MQTNPRRLSRLLDRHCTCACVAKTMSQHTRVSQVSQCINAQFNELAIPPFSMRYPSKMPKKNYLHSCDCARCKRRYTFSYSTVRRYRMIYGVESEATVPETASTTACANATMDSNSSTHSKKKDANHILIPQVICFFISVSKLLTFWYRYEKTDHL